MAILLVLLLGLTSALPVSAATTDSMAHVYVYHVHHWFDVDIHPTLSCNNNVISRVPSGVALEFDIAPGRRRLHVHQHALDADDWADLKAGKTYYLQLKVSPGGSGNLELIEVPESEAKTAIRKLKMLPADKVVSPGDCPLVAEH